MNEQVIEWKYTFPGQFYIFSCLQLPYIKWLTPKSLFLLSLFLWISGPGIQQFSLGHVNWMFLKCLQLSVSRAAYLSPKHCFYSACSVLQGTVHLVVYLITQFIDWQCLKFLFYPSVFLSLTIITSIQAPLISCLTK